MKPRIPYSKTDPARVTWVEAQGIYKRKIGFSGKGDGNDYATFYLGGEEAEARARANRLQELWDSATANGERRWTETTLPFAKAIAKGETVFVVEPGKITGLPLFEIRAPGNAPIVSEELQQRPEWYLQEIAELNRTYRGIRFVASAPEVLEAGKARSEGQIGTLRKRLISLHGDLGQKISTVAETSPHQLWTCIDAHAAEIRATYLEKRDEIKNETSGWGDNFAASVERLKASHPDVTLDLFDLPAIEKMISYWKARPYRKGTLRRISTDTVNDQLSSLKRFIKWLHKSKVYGWRKPEDYEEDIFRFRKQDLMTVEEKAKRTIPLWTLEELATLWKYGTTWERVFILLGLNFGFAQSEIRSLRNNEVFVADARVKRIRIKSGIYGEFLVWPETAKALQWSINETSRRRNLNETDVIISLNTGKEMTYKDITKIWRRLIRRIRKDQKAFRWLPFKYLRKTAGQFVQKVSDEATASVFLCHGKRTADSQLEVYTNREFERVFAANEAVHRLLAPVLASAQEEFTGGKKVGGGNISLGTVERIKRHWMQGATPAEIINACGVSRATVYRQIKKFVSEGLAQQT